MGSLIQVESLLPGVSILTLARPDQRNALSIELLQQFCEAIERLASQSEQRVVILRGAGPVFSAGLDLREAADETRVEKSAASVGRALDLLRDTSLVSIAAVHGGAYAGGAGLMATCDIVISTDDARFGFPEARRGLLPALICKTLHSRVREGDLRDLLLTGEIITALRALHVGLVQRVVPANQLLNEARRVAEQILDGGPETIRQTRRLLNQMSEGRGLSKQFLDELHLTARRGDEAREGLAAFSEKRVPSWSRERST
ncbi:histidine kinase [Planctomyces sp. SCGC AG-212-M04]|nr:histidine kinase [Planctomyces sp. SCGC AG-212-M04]